MKHKNQKKKKKEENEIENLYSISIKASICLVTLTLSFPLLFFLSYSQTLFYRGLVLIPVSMQRLTQCVPTDFAKIWSNSH